MLYESAQFEPLTDEPWDPARVEDAIATIVTDADAAFDLTALWPAHEWEGWEEPLPLKTLYVGAAGVIWALDALRRRGHAETSLDLAAAALRTLELKRTAPDFTADEHYHPASLLCGETGPLLVAFRLASDPALADDLDVARPRERRQPDRRRELGRTGDTARRPGDGRMDGRAALEGGSAQDGHSAARTPWRRLALAAGRRLPRPRHAARRCRQHARPASARGRTTRSRPRPGPFSPSMCSARTTSPTGPAHRFGRSSRGREMVGSVYSGARALRASSPAPGSTSMKTCCSPAPS